jgi:uncharacterized protein YbjT (DUF2867 family)
MILVTGATGNIGRPLLDCLHRAGIPVRAVTRNPSTANLPAHVEVVEGDPSRPATIAPALRGVTRLLLNPTTTRGSVVELLALAREHGVRQTVLVSLLATQTHPDLGLSRAGLATERAVRESGLSWTILRPGQFASNTLGWAHSIRSEGTVRAPFANVGLPAIHPSDIAEVAAVALTGGGHDERIYALTGPEPITPPQQVAAIGAAIGRSLRFEEITVEQAAAHMARHVPAELVDDALDLNGRALNAEGLRVHDTVQQVTGRAPRSYREWARDNARAFQ